MTKEKYLNNFIRTYLNRKEKREQIENEKYFGGEKKRDEISTQSNHRGTPTLESLDNVKIGTNYLSSEHSNRQTVLCPLVNLAIKSSRSKTKSSTYGIPRA